ncbi:MAG TPA: BlaI/MecI/CopY family transcriptional regulator [Gemmatimonas aurantiaca]|uniref:BlaI family transcriptional regulator n=2 Tax=Gemmatimonas aurantiaca TaxID=173480 RepID=C1A740_GEMAT|nr:BlaI/MecI/CopY family transcriptional regulator [Gemmatimonas aurantiaca]BAH38050.1 BlaI family transcriptional regulator [Gemmatimonas aurantiaca T-27]HCT56824.1 BlaI/MecI/CopY family transcriptional regulator [Gemmatimonas aurantiaca]
MDDFSLGARELDVMTLLWQHGSGTATEIRERLEADLAYTTVLTILRNLEAKGLLRHEPEGRAHRYFPRVEQRIAQQSALQRVLGSFFGGSAESLLARLVDDQHVDAAELQAIARRITEGQDLRRRDTGSRPVPNQPSTTKRRRSS